MKSFTVSRKFERDVIKTVYEDVECEVPLTQITHQDMMTMKHSQLRRYASELRMFIKRLVEVNDPSPDNIADMTHFEATEEPEIKITEATEANEEVKGAGNSGKATGAKIGKTSKYHYVSLNRKSSRWIASLKMKGSSIHVKSFDSEIETALAVDAYLDKIDDQLRPRNRNEFHEVMEIFIRKQA